MSRSRKKDYTGVKRFSKGCRNHGSCKICSENRTRYKQKAPSLDEGLEDCSECLPCDNKPVTSAT